MKYMYMLYTQYILWEFNSQPQT